MKRILPLPLLLAIFILACNNSQVETNVNLSTSTSSPNLSVQTFSPEGNASSIATETTVAVQTSTKSPPAVTSTFAPTPTLFGTYDNEVTWHPQDILLNISESANDGNPWIVKWPLLRLYWDGTIIQGAGDNVKVSQLSRPQMCKLFNSIAQTGWFNVDHLAYSPVFAGTWAESIGVYIWQERVGGGYLFTSALEGAGAREPLFCGDCIRTNQDNFIDAAESNTYYLIFNNLPTDFQIKTNFEEPRAVSVNYQITCKVSDGAYPFVPVDQEAKYVIFSSSGRRAVGILNQNSADVSSAIYKIDGSKQYFTYDPKSFGAGTLTIVPRLWAKDNQHVYLTLYPNGVKLQPFQEAMALQKIDTNTGQTSYLFQGQVNDSYSYALSSTGSRLAYIRQNQNPLELVILDLETDNETKLTVETPDIPAEYYEMAGGLEFNFEINRLFFSAISDQDSLKTTFFMVDLLAPTKLHVVDQRSGAYKIKYLSSEWMEICAINEGLTEDDYCFGDKVKLP